MQNSFQPSAEFQQLVKAQLKGNWKSVLEQHLGAEVLAKPNQPCPFCGGSDRFSFTDKFGNGDCYCRHCGHRDGIKVIMDLTHKNFSEVIVALGEQLGIPAEVPSEPKPKKAKSRKTFTSKDLWNLGSPIEKDTSADRYLSSRGLDGRNFQSLRFFDHLRYAEKSKDGASWEEKYYEGILCRIDSSEEECFNVLRIYLDNGQKAKVKAPKKVFGKEISGGFIKLGEINPEDGRLGLAEGVETAMSAGILHEMPVWSVISAFNFKNFVPPEEVKELFIFADNDSNFVGQKEAFTAPSVLAQKYKSLKISVVIPPEVNSDWNDVLLSSKR